MTHDECNQATANMLTLRLRLCRNSGGDVDHWRKDSLKFLVGHPHDNTADEARAILAAIESKVAA